MNPLMGFTFIPQNDEEKLWKVYNRITDLADIDATPNELLWYSNGRLRIKQHIEVPNLPIATTKRFMYRSIIYAFRIFTDEELNRKIAILKIWSEHFQSIERTRRAIYKFWSCNPEITGRAQFEQQRLIIDNVHGRNYGVFMQTMMWLMAWGILDLHRKSVFNNSVPHVQLTDLGKAIVRLHRDEHLIF